LNAAEAIGDRPGRIAISTGSVEAGADDFAGTHGWSDPRPGSYAFVRVADTGRGLDVVARERLFDPFYTTKRAGRGLGLAGVAGVLRRRRGVARVEASRPNGTIFTAWFPRVR
jgi:signal transduction histidine kinase